jgi:histidine triad (HIT) family protein
VSQTEPRTYRAPGDPPLLCAFCRIVHGEHAEGDPVPLVVGDFPHALAFVPLAPAAWGHTLVIPKRHVESLGELRPGYLVEAVLTAVQRMDARLRGALNPDGMNLIQSTGAAAGQTVPHLHFHLVPRWDDDHLGDLWAKGRERWNGYRGNETWDQRRARMAEALKTADPESLRGVEA